MRIHEEIKGRNKYCGPAVIAYLTGVSTDDGAAMIRHVSGQSRVRGAYTVDLVAALGHFGLKATKRGGAQGVRGMTLAQWLKHSKCERTSGRVFLVVAGNHFQLITGRRYACGRIRNGLVSIKDKRVKRRARVETVHEITGAVRVPKILESKKDERRILQAARLRAKKLADAHGITIDIDDGGREYPTHYWVHAKDAIEAHQDYPWRGDHICCDWLDVEGRVKQIIEFEKSIPECDPLGVLWG